VRSIAIRSAANAVSARGRLRCERRARPLQATDELVRGAFVADATLNALKRRYDDKQLLDREEPEEVDVGRWGGLVRNH
jgi:hypothetical protein